MDWNNRFCSRAKDCFESSRIHCISLIVYIDENRPGSHIEHGIGGGDERQRWNKNFIARSNAERMQDQVKCCGAGPDSDRIVGFMAETPRVKGR